MEPYVQVDGTSDPTRFDAAETHQAGFVSSIF